jgi:ribosomal protein L37E
MTSTTDNPDPPRDPAATPVPPREGLGEGLPPHIDQSKLDAAGCVATDTPCDQCGYNLRTLHVSARCPECGYPVMRALRSGMLRDAPRTYIRRLIHGADALLVAVLLSGGVASAFLAAIVRDILLASALRVALIAACCLIPVLCIVGVFLLTGRQPDEPPSTKPSLRSQLRFAVMIGMAPLELAAIELIIPLSAAIPELLAAVVMVIATLVSVFVLPFMLAAFIARLARRLEPARASGRAAAGVSVVIALLVVLPAAILSPNSSGALPIIAVPYACLLAILTSFRVNLTATLWTTRRLAAAAGSQEDAYCREDD